MKHVVSTESSAVRKDAKYFVAHRQEEPKACPLMTEGFCVLLSSRRHAKKSGCPEAGERGKQVSRIAKECSSGPLDA